MEESRVRFLKRNWKLKARGDKPEGMTQDDSTDCERGGPPWSRINPGTAFEWWKGGAGWQVALVYCSHLQLAASIGPSPFAAPPLDPFPP